MINRIPKYLFKLRRNRRNGLLNRSGNTVLSGNRFLAQTQQRRQENSSGNRSTRHSETVRRRICLQHTRGKLPNYPSSTFATGRRTIREKEPRGQAAIDEHQEEKSSALGGLTTPRVTVASALLGEEQPIRRRERRRPAPAAMRVDRALGPLFQTPSCAQSRAFAFRAS